MFSTADKKTNENKLYVTYAKPDEALAKNKLTKFTIKQQNRMTKRAARETL